MGKDWSKVFVFWSIISIGVLPGHVAMLITVFQYLQVLCKRRQHAAPLYTVMTCVAFFFFQVCNGAID